jgi:hypothetical protein
MQLLGKAGNQRGKNNQKNRVSWLKVFSFRVVRLYITHVIAITFQNNFINALRDPLIFPSIKQLLKTAAVERSLAI